MRTEEPAERLQRRLGADTSETGHTGELTTTDDARPDTALSRWLPDSGAPAASGWLAAVRADPGRAGVIGLGVLGVVAVLVTLFTVWRDQPPPVSSAKIPDVQMISSASASPGPPATGAPVVVSVVGLVHKPGLVTLSAGARIADALDAAGGPVDGADLLGLNMARRLSDGEQIIVGIAPPPGQAPTMGSSAGPQEGPSPVAAAGPAPAGPTGVAGEPVNLNTATAEQLDTLPGIGPVTAAAIIAWRDANGSFASVDQLGDVNGIGPARLEKLRDLVHV